MTSDNNIPIFTASDIEKYHRGLLSNAAMHEMEKAALEDPFLADALEGYAVAGVNGVEDIRALKIRLAEKMEDDDSGIIAMKKGARSNSFPWFRAAAAVVIIGGAGLLGNQFLFNNKKKEIAELNKNNNTSGTPTAATEKDSVVVMTNSRDEGKVNEKNTMDTPVSTVTNGAVSNTLASDKETSTAASGNAGTKEADNNNYYKTDNKPAEVAAITKPAPVVTENGRADTEKITVGVTPGSFATKDVAGMEDLKRKEKKESNNEAVAAATNKSGVIPPPQNSFKTGADKNNAVAQKTEEQQYRSQHNNIFRGRITDANNVGVPYANVTNLEDKAGTYSDANGFFNLTSPDTVLTVQVRSIGFENTQARLRNNLPANQVVLQDDRKGLSEVVISNRKPNVAARNRDANKTLEEPQPSDGWDNYDTYLANNLVVPDDLTSKQNNTGSVQVSFEVDKNGEPVNIRVEKSLCGKCDKEAIRLVKDGPKWKRTANKKGRTTVTINF